VLSVTSTWVSFSFAEIALTFLVIKKRFGAPVSVSLPITSISLSVGLEKSTVSIVRNITFELLFDCTCKPSFILK